MYTVVIEAQDIEELIEKVASYHEELKRVRVATVRVAKDGRSTEARRQQHSRTMREYWASKTPEQREQHLQKMRDGQRKAHQHRAMAKLLDAIG